MIHRPLADRMRPQTLDAYVGQEHIVGEGTLINEHVANGSLPSMIFWGPPGSGKTTLARLLASEMGYDMRQLSATMHGVKDLREVFEKARRNASELFQNKTVLFIDEIHRFNKAQQDALLPYVEDGTVILIGATTENPSFEVNNALLSRARVFVLKELSEGNLTTIIHRALNDPECGLGGESLSLTEESLSLIVQFANGDARSALNGLESAAALARANMRTAITNDDIVTAFQQVYVQYDRDGEEHYNTISAFIKSMRASDTNAALYYLARMVHGGEDHKFIARRMVIFASEDIGIAQPTALVVANAVFRACETIGYPECQINLAHGTVYLAKAPKNRTAYEAYFRAKADVEEHGNLSIPMTVRNAPTTLMKELGYGKGYEAYPEAGSYLPTKLVGKEYYQEE